VSAEALHQVRAVDFRRVFDANSAYDVQRVLDTLLVVIEHAHALALHIQALHQLLVLCRDACRAPVGVALECLDAAKSKEHGTSAVAHVCAKRQVAHDGKAAYDFSGANDL